MDDDFSTAVESARAAIARLWPVPPRAAMILGTGLGALVQHVRQDAVIPFQGLPGFPRATALGHCGRIVCGQLGDVPLILLDGRCHLYEGYSVAEITLPVRVLQACGAPLLIVTNASGGLNPAYARGDIVVIDDHISLLQRPVARAGPPPGHNGVLCARHSPYDRGLMEAALQAARDHGFVAHGGVYVCVTGPNYETRAEYRFLRRIGGDVVGMSTVPEVCVGRALGMRILGLSVVTNVATPDSLQIVDAAEVVDVAAHAEPRVRHIVADVLRATR